METKTEAGTSGRQHQTYDHRLKRLVKSTGSIGPATAAGVPRSTARGWLRSQERPVVGVPEQLQATIEELQATIVALQRRNDRLLAILRLVTALLKVSGFTLHRRRVPEAHQKKLILRVVERSQRTLGLRASLHILRLSVEIPRVAP